MSFSYENILYDGEVTLTFNTAKHRYIWEEEDKIIRSVTQAINVIDKPALVWWASNMAVDYIADMIEPGKSYDEIELANIWQDARGAHNRRKKKAADHGTLLHKWIEDYINGEDPGVPVNKHLKRSAKRFLKWVKEHDVKFLLAEQVVFSRKYEYAGTTDFICEIDGELYIGDLKTSKGIYETMLIQTSAYRHAREEEFPEENYAGQVILRIGSDGTFETAFIRGDKAYKKLFKAFVYAHGLAEQMEFVKNYKPERKL